MFQGTRFDYEIADQAQSLGRESLLASSSIVGILHPEGDHRANRRVAVADGLPGAHFFVLHVDGDVAGASRAQLRSYLVEQSAAQLGAGKIRLLKDQIDELLHGYPPRFTADLTIASG